MELEYAYKQVEKWKNYGDLGMLNKWMSIEHKD